MLGQAIEEIIRKKTQDILCQRAVPELSDMVYTDNLGEVIEKLVILHCRMWMLEDALGLARTDSEIAALKKKTDICFKQKRPRLVEAINRMVDDAIRSGQSLTEDSVKLYEGVDK